MSSKDTSNVLGQTKRKEKLTSSSSGKSETDGADPEKRTKKVKVSDEANLAKDSSREKAHKKHKHDKKAVGSESSIPAFLLEDDDEQILPRGPVAQKATKSKEQSQEKKVKPSNLFNPKTGQVVADDVGDEKDGKIVVGGDLGDDAEGDNFDLDGDDDDLDLDDDAMTSKAKNLKSKKKSKNDDNLFDDEADDEDGLFDPRDGKLKKRSSAVIAHLATLNFTTMAVGMSVVGAVTDVHEHELVLRLADGCSAFVSLREVSDVMANLVDKFLEETEVKGSSNIQLPQLRDLYKVGDLVRGVIVKVPNTGASKASEARRAEVSLRPSLLHAGYTPRHVGLNLPLVGSVASVEEKGYLIDLGIPTGFGNEHVMGFLPKHPSPAAHPNKLIVGQTVEVVTTSALAEGSRVVTLSAAPYVVKRTVLTKAAFYPDALCDRAVAQQNSTATFEELRAGTLLRANIDRILPGQGLVLRFWDKYTGFVPIFHLSIPYTVGMDLANEYQVNQKVRARLLFVNTVTQAAQLTLRPCLVDEWSLMPIPDSLAVGKVIENARVLGVAQNRALLLDVSNALTQNERLAALKADNEARPKAPESDKVREERVIRSISTGYVGKRDISDQSDASLTDMKVGSLVTARVISHDPLTGLPHFSLRPSIINRIAFRPRDLTPGLLVNAKVIRVLKKAVLMSIAGTSMRGYLALDHMTDTPTGAEELSAAMKTKYALDTEHKTRILSISENKIFLTAKPKLLRAEREDCVSTLQEIAQLARKRQTVILPGVIANVRHNGILIRFFGNLTGFVKLVDLVRSGHVPEGKSPLDVGFVENATVMVRVLIANLEQGYLGLSLGVTERAIQADPRHTIAITGAVNPDLEDIKIGDVLTGYIKEWKTEDTSSPDAKLLVVLDHPDDTTKKLNATLAITHVLDHGSLERIEDEVPIDEDDELEGLDEEDEDHDEGDSSMEFKSNKKSSKLTPESHDGDEPESEVDSDSENDMDMDEDMDMDLDMNEDMDEEDMLQYGEEDEDMDAISDSMDDDDGALTAASRYSVTFTPSRAVITTVENLLRNATKTKFVIIGINRKSGEITVSMRSLLISVAVANAKRAASEQTEETAKTVVTIPTKVSDVTEGMLVVGTVGRTKEASALVHLLGGLSGLVTLRGVPSLVSNRKLADLRRTLDVGQTVLAKVVKVFEDTKKGRASVLLELVTETGTIFSTKYLQILHDQMENLAKLVPASKHLSVVTQGSVINHAKIAGGADPEEDFLTLQLPMLEQVDGLKYVALADKTAGHAPEDIVAEALKKVKRDEQTKRVHKQVACRVLHVSPSLTEEEPNRVFVSLKSDLVHDGQELAAEARAQLQELKTKKASTAIRHANASVPTSLIDFLESKSFYATGGRVSAKAFVRARIELILPEEGCVILSLPDYSSCLAWASLASTSVNFAPLALSEEHGELKPGVEYQCQVVQAPRDVPNVRNVALIVELPFNEILDKVEGRGGRKHKSASPDAAKLDELPDIINAKDIKVGKVLRDVATVVAISTFPGPDGPARVFVRLGNSSVYGRVTVAEISDDPTERPWESLRVGETLPLVTVFEKDTDGFQFRRDRPVDQYVCSLRSSRPELLKVLASGKKPSETEDASRFGTEIRVDVIKPEDVKKGMLLQGVVCNVTKMGLFISVSHYIRGLVRLSDVSDTFVDFETLKQQIKPGQLVVVRAIANGADIVESEKRAIPMSMKESVVQNTNIRLLEALEPMMIVKGRVVKVKDVGVIIQLKHSTLTALAHISECSDTRITPEQLKNHYKPGDKVKAVVLAVSRSHGKISVGLRASRFQEAASRMDEQKQIVDSDDSDDEEVEEQPSLGKTGHLPADSDSEESSEDEVEQQRAERLKVMAQKKAMDVGKSKGTEAPTQAPTKIETLADVEEAATLSTAQSPFTAFVFDLAAKSAKQSMMDAKRESMESKFREIADPEEASENKEDAQTAKGAQKDKKKKKNKKDETSSKPVAFDEEEGELLSISDDEDEAERLNSIRSSMHSVIEAERALMEDGVAKSEDDHERNLVRHPSNSYLWVQYIAFFIERSEFSKARAVAERALNTINVAEVGERWNIWVAMMSLEVSYGSKQSLDDVVKRAQKYNDQLKVLMELARIQQAADKIEDAHLTWHAAAKRVGTARGELTVKVYASWIELWYSNSNVTKGRELLEMALSKLPADAQLQLMIRVAQFEYDYHYQGSSPERGRTMFEKIFTQHPKRLDIWTVLVDKELKSFRLMKDRAGVRPSTIAAKLKAIRNVFDLAAGESKWSVYNAKQMRYIFGRLIAFEQEFGTEESLEVAQSKARAYVESVSQ